MTASYPDEVWSTTTVNGQRLTWRELAEMYRRDLADAQKFVTMMMDLDRCEHGRHEGDVCDGCEKSPRRRQERWLLRGSAFSGSYGNPFLDDLSSYHDESGPEYIDRQIGYTMNRTPIVVPARDLKHEPSAWVHSPPPATGGVEAHRHLNHLVTESEDVDGA